MALRTLSRRALASGARQPDAVVAARWERALATPDADDGLLPSLLDDWSGFSGLDWPEMLRRVARADAELAAEFAQRRPRSTAELDALYAETATLIPLLLWWHATDLTPARAAVAAAEILTAAGARLVLDFGCGIGSTALLLADAGFEIMVAEVAPDPLALASWRLRRRGFTAPAIDLRQRPLAELEPCSIDAAVAFDVLEHLPEVAPALTALDRVLAPHGVLVLNQVYVPANEGPHHFAQSGEALLWLHSQGYCLAHVPYVCWVAQKTPLGAARHRAQGAELRARIAVARAAAQLDRRLATRIVGRALR